MSPTWGQFHHSQASKQRAKKLRELMSLPFTVREACISWNLLPKWTSTEHPDLPGLGTFALSVRQVL